MQDSHDDDAAYTALLEKMVLDAGMELPDIYDGLRGQERKEHSRRVGKIRSERWAKEKDAYIAKRRAAGTWPN